MSRLINIAKSTLLSGGIINNDSLGGYISNSARRALGLSIAQFQDGQVHYFSKNVNLLKRAAIQIPSQAAYGMLRSYPRYLKYWEQRERDKHLQTNSPTSIANKNGQYYQLIKDQQAVAEKKKYKDTIVGNIVTDYLELKIKKEGYYFDTKTGKIETNSKYSEITFVDLQPVIQVSQKNNIVLTQVQGRDFTRKEFISGGDYEISISGKITSKYPDVYPEAEVSKFLKLMQFKGIIDCSNTILNQFKISQIIIQGYQFGQSDYRNIQPYSFTCVAVEPAESIELILAEQEKVIKAIHEMNKWIKYTKFATDIIEPSSLLNLSKLWI